MSQYTMLSSLTQQSDDKKIMVRVGRIWGAVNRKNNMLLHTNVILLDEKEDHILAVVRNNQKDTFLAELKEDVVYNITNLKLVPGPKLYRTVDIDFSLNFFYKTKIEKIEDTGLLPRYKFELQPFHNIKNLVGQIKCLIDVIGMVTTYGQLEKWTNGAEKMDVVLTDISDEKIIVTLWEDKATHFITALKEAKEKASFVVITGLLAKRFSDRPSLSSTDATGTYFNIDYAPLNALRQKMSASLGVHLESLPPPASTQFVTMEENEAKEVPIKSILEAEIPEGKNFMRYLCKGTITDILNGNGWYYICCPTCAKAICQMEGNFFCSSCSEVPNTVTQRYRVVIRIEDKTDTTTLTLFNKEAEQIIGVPLQKLLTEMDKHEAVAPIPPVVKNIIGKTCAFQIKVTPYNIINGCEEYTVTRVSEDQVSKTSNPDTTSVENLKKKQKCT